MPRSKTAKARAKRGKAKRQARDGGNEAAFSALARNASAFVADNEEAMQSAAKAGEARAVVRSHGVIQGPNLESIGKRTAATEHIQRTGDFLGVEDGTVKPCPIPLGDLRRLNHHVSSDRKVSVAPVIRRAPMPAGSARTPTNKGSFWRIGGVQFASGGFRWPTGPADYCWDMAVGAWVHRDKDGNLYHGSDAPRLEYRRGGDTASYVRRLARLHFVENGSIPHHLVAYFDANGRRDLVLRYIRKHRRCHAGDKPVQFLSDCSDSWIKSQLTRAVNSYNKGIRPETVPDTWLPWSYDVKDLRCKRVVIRRRK